jgi:hypothetical protein
MTTNGMTTRQRTPNVGPLRNGARTSRLTLGQLPPKLARLQRGVNQYRAALEAATIERHGQISILHAHQINLAASAELQAAVAYWALRQRAETMTTADTLACADAITKARTKRNAAVAALGLDPPSEAELLRQLYVDPLPATDPPAATPAASEGTGPTSETTAPPDAPQANVSDSSAGINQDSQAAQDSEGTEA